MAKKEEATTALATPGTMHTLEERRVINEDVLKVTGHELKREFTRRVEETTAHRQKCYEDLGDYMHAYNTAAQKCWEEVLPGIVSDLEVSFSVLNRLADEDDDQFHVVLSVNEKALLFGLQGMEKDGYYHQGETFLSKMRNAYLKDAGSAADDLSVPLSIVIKRADYTEMNVDRVLEVTATSELQDARIALIKASEPFYEACELVKKAQKDLSDLPKNMEELDIQATARRIRDMGGEDALREVLGSAMQILGGDTVKGLAAALPGYKPEDDGDVINAEQ